MEITVEKYKSLLDDSRKLAALEAGGVDNWEWYGESLKEYYAENEKDEIIEDTVTEICEAVCECIEQPAGSGCGYGVNDKGVENLSIILINFLKKIKEVE